MRTIRTNLIIVLTITAFTAYGQKIRVKSGDRDDLAQFKKYNIEYHYDNVSVGKFDKEEDYVEKKVSEYNEDEAGKGDRWKENWFGDREARYHPKFEELFNKNIEKADVIGKEGIDAPCTMKVYTTFIEPGFNVGIVRKNASIDLRIEFVQDGKKLVEMTIEKSPGAMVGGMDFDTGSRISEAYAKAGKELGKYMRKKVY